MGACTHLRGLVRRQGSGARRPPPPYNPAPPPYDPGQPAGGWQRDPGVPPAPGAWQADPYGAPPPGSGQWGAPPPRSGPPTGLIIVIVVLVVAAVGGLIVLLTSGDDDDDGGTAIGDQGNAPTTLPDGGDGGDLTTLPDITLPDDDGGSGGGGIGGGGASGSTVDLAADWVYGNTPLGVYEEESQCIAEVVIGVVGEDVVAQAGGDLSIVYAGTSSDEDSAISSGISSCVDSETASRLADWPGWPWPPS